MSDQAQWSASGQAQWSASGQAQWSALGQVQWRKSWEACGMLRTGQRILLCRMASDFRQQCIAPSSRMSEPARIRTSASGALDLCCRQERGC